MCHIYLPFYLQRKRLLKLFGKPNEHLSLDNRSLNSTNEVKWVVLPTNGVRFVVICSNYNANIVMMDRNPVIFTIFKGRWGTFYQSRSDVVIGYFMWRRRSGRGGVTFLFSHVFWDIWSPWDISARYSSYFTDFSQLRKTKQTRHFQLTKYVISAN